MLENNLKGTSEDTESGTAYDYKKIELDKSDLGRLAGRWGLVLHKKFKHFNDLLKNVEEYSKSRKLLLKDYLSAIDKKKIDGSSDDSSASKETDFEVTPEEFETAMRLHRAAGVLCLIGREILRRTRSSSCRRIWHYLFSILVIFFGISLRSVLEASINTTGSFNIVVKEGILSPTWGEGYWPCYQDFGKSISLYPMVEKSGLCTNGTSELSWTLTQKPFSAPLKRDENANWTAGNFACFLNDLSVSMIKKGADNWITLCYGENEIIVNKNKIGPKRPTYKDSIEGMLYEVNGPKIDFETHANLLVKYLLLNEEINRQMIVRFISDNFIGNETHERDAVLTIPFEGMRFNWKSLLAAFGLLLGPFVFAFWLKWFTRNVSGKINIRANDEEHLKTLYSINSGLPVCNITSPNLTPEISLVEETFGNKNSLFHLKANCERSEVRFRRQEDTERKEKIKKIHWELIQGETPKKLD